MPKSKPKSSTSTSSFLPTITIDTCDIIRLILSYLTSLGLHNTADCLRRESSIGFTQQTSILSPSKMATHIIAGEWDVITKSLRLQQSLTSLQIKIHHQIILELAEESGGNNNNNNMDLAYNIFRMLRDDLETVYEEEDDEEVLLDDDDDANKKSKGSSSTKITLGRSIEQKLAAILADPTKYSSEESLPLRQSLLYNGQTGSKARQARRDHLAQLMLQEEKEQQIIPLDLDRLPTLLQQAIQWQSHTGQLPMFLEEEEEEEEQESEEEHEEDEDDDKKSRKKKKKKKKQSSKKRKRRRRRFDLLLGTNDSIEMQGNDEEDLIGDIDEDEPIIEDVYNKIKFGKSAVCETAIWSTIASSTNQNQQQQQQQPMLITGSSDGLIEIWNGKNCILNTIDYPYQNESVMGHSSDSRILSLAVSNDGQILVSGDNNGKLKIWKLSTGQCLRQYQAFTTSNTADGGSGGGAVTCLSLTRDGSKILVGSSSGQIKEVGIVSQILLQEYIGHTSYINSCQYVYYYSGGGDRSSSNSNNNTATTTIINVNIVTGSADGTVRIWQSKGGECIRILQPPSTATLSSSSSSSSSLVVSQTHVLTESPAISNILLVPPTSSSTMQQMIIVPRSNQAYMIDIQGNIIRTFQTSNTDSDTIFCDASCCTSTWLYLVTEDGKGYVFSLKTGKLQKTINDMGLKSTYNKNNNAKSPELTQLVSHPHKPYIAALSNDKIQSRGILTVWK